MCGHRPFADRCLACTIWAGGGWILRPAKWTLRPRLKRIERLLALSTSPKRSNGWQVLAPRAGESGTARSFGETQQYASVLKSGPAIQQDKESKGAKPDRSAI